MFIMQLIIFFQYEKEEIIPSGGFSGKIQCWVASSQPVVVWSQTQFPLNSEVKRRV